jgi:diaminohydroxyphosphoribosylaminopyrimidine deaminase/5-amino-6-(5-phosphoribosylamino)uracil reductase
MDEHYMERCLELASKGLGSVAPNPMVGCVIVHGDRIIGEGYHRVYGEAHAEVNAIASVKDPGLLSGSTLYVNLEPCSHQGKTPACSRLILDRKIPRVVIGKADPNPVVAGKGLRMLKEGGTEVRTGVMEKECLELNKRFFTWHREKRPWVLLKWARTRDGFIDRLRPTENPDGVSWITNPPARQWVHKWRSEEQAILVGTRTALLDDPQLTVRHWQGRNPLRLVIDRKGTLPGHLKLFDGIAETLVFTSEPGKVYENAGCIQIPGSTDYLPAILGYLYEHEIQSLLVEGGAALLNSFIRSGLWDEARVFTGNAYFGQGIPSPVLPSVPVHRITTGDDLLEIYSKMPRSHATKRGEFKS